MSQRTYDRLHRCPCSQTAALVVACVPILMLLPGWERPQWWSWFLWGHVTESHRLIWSYHDLCISVIMLKQLACLRGSLVLSLLGDTLGRHRRHRLLLSRSRWQHLMSGGPKSEPCLQYGLCCPNLALCFLLKETADMTFVFYFQRLSWQNLDTDPLISADMAGLTSAGKHWLIVA